MIKKITKLLLSATSILLLILISGTSSAATPGKTGEGCWALDRCADGYSCQPGVHKCYPIPRELGQPCVAGHSCGSGLYCAAGKHVCVALKVGDRCDWGQNCGTGLVCNKINHAVSRCDVGRYLTVKNNSKETAYTYHENWTVKTGIAGPHGIDVAPGKQQVSQVHQDPSHRYLLVFKSESAQENYIALQFAKTAIKAVITEALSQQDSVSTVKQVVESVIKEEATDIDAPNHVKELAKFMKENEIRDLRDATYGGSFTIANNGYFHDTVVPTTLSCTVTDSGLTKQDGWKWDKKSHNLMYSKNGTAISPAPGGKPDFSGSANYVLYMVPTGCTYKGVGEQGWRWDRKSQNLMFSLNGNAISPAGGSPDYQGSANYVLFKLQNGIAQGPLKNYQTAWKWDRKSQNLMYSAGKAISPAGGAPNYQGSANYALERQ